ncbi:hypothetical protein SLA2020_528830 [Shorea laevis]
MGVFLQYEELQQIESVRQKPAYGTVKFNCNGSLKLASMLNGYVVVVRNTEGLKIIDSPDSDLFFADDSTVFCGATLEEMSHLQAILQLYGDATGQRVNFTKSAAIFSPNTPNEVRDLICDRFGIQLQSTVSKCLGLPISWGRSNKDSLNM